MRPINVSTLLPRMPVKPGKKRLELRRQAAKRALAPFVAEQERRERIERERRRECEPILPE